jgi:two-component system, OmpR family, response regulator PhoP
VTTLVSQVIDHDTDPIKIAIVAVAAVQLDQNGLLELVAQGFTFTSMAKAMELYRLMLSQDFDIVVLENPLPDEDDSTIVRQLRAHSSTMGIVVLGPRHALEECAYTTYRGADAYLPRPVDIQVLKTVLLGMGNRLRQARHAHHVCDDMGNQASWRLDMDDWYLTSPNGTRIALSRAEYKVLASLMTAGGDVIARDVLIGALCTDIESFDPHRLEMTIHRLRRKVTRQSKQTLPLQTVRKAGYVFSMDWLAS